ncbi:MAG: alpha-ketoglutarate-dependent dioxygenase AlkB [Bacteroidetes bacterium]|nr:MAG: alpha-ketoglutarate-dependent dioxygenase AlkB [Bacteroidota bacterium]
MDLFNNTIDHNTNVLSKDGIVNYYGTLLSVSQSNSYFDQLLHNVEWKNDEAFMYGKRIVTKRKVAWYGDKPYQYTYSNTTKLALPWTTALLELKEMVEQKTEEKYNSCLLNLYHNGSEGMAWHSDGEKDLKKNGAIASLSLGAERKFAFKHKETKEKVSLLLKNGSLLVMKGATQTFWLHRLPPTKLIHTPRINLTFRTIMQTKK